MQRIIEGAEYILIDEKEIGSCKGCAFEHRRIENGMVSCTEVTNSTECREMKKIYKEITE